MAKQTPLHDWHVERGAKMTEFAGWKMPLHYGSILAEHEATRKRATLFDLCHMTRVRITGADTAAFLETLLPLDTAKLEEGQVAYSFLCQENGGIIDDVTLYKSEDYYLLVANAANHEPVLRWLQTHRGGARVELEDLTDSMCMLAIQGPLAEAILQPLCQINLSLMKYYHFFVLALTGARALVSRTGYTGEDGFEIYCGRAYFQTLWDRLLQAGAPAGLIPAGLGARDLLRLEAAMPLYGHELSLDTTPIEAGLEKFVDFDNRNFLARAALFHSTSSEFSRRLICFEMLDRAIPRADAPIEFEAIPIGRVTSGAFSPSLQKGIGMGYVDAIRAAPGSNISIEIRGALHPARIVKRPFYRRPKKS